MLSLSWSWVFHSLNDGIMRAIDVMVPLAPSVLLMLVFEQQCVMRVVHQTVLAPRFTSSPGHKCLLIAGSSVDCVSLPSTRLCTLVSPSLPGAVLSTLALSSRSLFLHRCSSIGGQVGSLPRLSSGPTMRTAWFDDQKLTSESLCGQLHIGLAHRSLVEFTFT